jgi:hypothetical protein
VGLPVAINAIAPNTSAQYFARLPCMGLANLKCALDDAAIDAERGACCC